MPVYAQAPKYDIDPVGDFLGAFTQVQNIFQQKQKMAMEQERNALVMSKTRMEMDHAETQNELNLLKIENYEADRKHQMNLQKVQMKTANQNLKLAEENLKKSLAIKERAETDSPVFMKKYDDLINDARNIIPLGMDMRTLSRTIGTYQSKLATLMAQSQHLEADSRFATEVLGKQGEVNAILSRLSSSADTVAAHSEAEWSNGLGQHIGFVPNYEDPNGSLTRLNAKIQAFEQHVEIYGPLAAHPVYGKKYQEDVARIRGAFTKDKEALLTHIQEVEKHKNKQTSGEAQVDKNFAETYTNWTSQQAAYHNDMEKLDRTLEALEDPDKNLSGPWISFIPDRLRPDGTMSKEDVESVVQKNLKAILGGAFAQQEAKEMLSRAYNNVLDDPKNAQKVKDLAQTMRVIYAGAKHKVDYYESNRFSLKGYKQPSYEELSGETGEGTSSVSVEGLLGGVDEEGNVEE